MLEKEDELLQEKATAQCFDKLVPLRDILSLVVVAHLFVEYWLEWLIRDSLKRPEKLLDSGLTFSQKLAVAESMGLLQGELLEAVRAVNKIRNKVVHNLAYKATPEDLRLLAKFVPTLNSEQQLISEKLGSPKYEIVTFCMYFAGYAVGFTCGLRESRK